MHSASLFLQPRLSPHLRDLLIRARTAGATTSVDPNWDPAGRWTDVHALLDCATALVPNTVELLALTGCPDVGAAASRVISAGRQVALKNGAAGGILWDVSGAMTTVPVPATDVIDTTGAGDSFGAGFISGMLEGLPGQACLERAVQCGSLSTRSVGGTAAQATRADLAD